MLFERQQYQEDCVSNILKILEFTDGLENLSTSVLENGIRHIQKESNILIKNIRPDLRLDVLMETGTGKTFTYLKTMYEMNKRFGINKFVVFVPRLAIRAGIIQNINLTADYFFREYGKRIKKHTYGGGLSQVEDFIRNEQDFSVLILTAQSITVENRDTRVLTRRHESLFLAEAPLSAIGKLKPITFIDEPHLLQGEKFINKYEEYFSKSLLLRFGATFPDRQNERLSNVIYTLDSISAFQDYLVKKISVTTLIDGKSAIKFYKPDKSLILTYFKEGVEYKSNIRLKENIAAITKDPAHNFHVIRIKGDEVILSNKERITLSSSGYILIDDTIRRMIETTIKIHFEKEEQLFKKGIKTLSLFFIPSIADYRGDNPRIKNIFEEEYKKQRAEKLKESIDASYRDYLRKDFDDGMNLCVHEGYFSGDRGTKDAKENEGINLILNDKSRLLSTEVPLRFIFSVWALQEGWDNPNIFTLCKLASTDKETKRRQQVGRGLRLAVDDEGKRQTRKYCEEIDNKFYGINTLDVIVSGQERNFIEGIQKEIIGDNITSNQLSRDALIKIGLDSSQVSRLIVFLEDRGVISIKGDDIWDINKPMHTFLEENKDMFPPQVAEYYEDLIREFKNASYFSIQNRNKKTDQIGIRQNNFQKFEDLWRKITNKARIVYREIDEDALLNAIAQAFNRETIYPLKVRLEKKTYNAQINQIEVESITTLGEQEFFKNNSYVSFIADFANRENLPLYFCVKIFNAIDSNKVKNNPRRAYDLLAKIVKDGIHRSIIQSIEYDFKGEIEIDTRDIFYENNQPKKAIDATAIGKYIDQTTVPASHYLYDKIVYDSKIELDVVKIGPAEINEGKENTVAYDSGIELKDLPPPPPR